LRIVGAASALAITGISCSVALPRSNMLTNHISNHFPTIKLSITIKLRNYNPQIQSYQPPEINFSAKELTSTFFKPNLRIKIKSRNMANQRDRTLKFRRLMDQNNWTQAELSRQLGVSRAWVTKTLLNNSR